MGTESLIEEEIRKDEPSLFEIPENDKSLSKEEIQFEEEYADASIESNEQKIVNEKKKTLQEGEFKEDGIKTENNLEKEKLSIAVEGEDGTVGGTKEMEDKEESTKVSESTGVTENADSGHEPEIATTDDGEEHSSKDEIKAVIDATVLVSTKKQKVGTLEGNNNTQTEEDIKIDDTTCNEIKQKATDNEKENSYIFMSNKEELEKRKEENEMEEIFKKEDVQFVQNASDVKSEEIKENKANMWEFNKEKLSKIQERDIKEDKEESSPKENLHHKADKEDVASKVVKLDKEEDIQDIESKKSIIKEQHDDIEVTIKNIETKDDINQTIVQVSENQLKEANNDEEEAVEKEIVKDIKETNNSLKDIEQTEDSFIEEKKHQEENEDENKFQEDETKKVDITSEDIDDKQEMSTMKEKEIPSPKKGEDKNAKSEKPQIENFIEDVLKPSTKEEAHISEDDKDESQTKEDISTKDSNVKAEHTQLKGVKEDTELSSPAKEEEKGISTVIEYGGKSIDENKKENSFDKIKEESSPKENLHHKADKEDVASKVVKLDKEEDIQDIESKKSIIKEQHDDIEVTIKNIETKDDINQTVVQVSENQLKEANNDEEEAVEKEIEKDIKETNKSLKDMEQTEVSFIEEKKHQEENEDENKFQEDETKKVV